MKIAILGSAPSSIRLAPFGDPSWMIWGCSPGVYAYATRVNAWFELHRWEPPVLGNAASQVPWFSPEYVGWMAGLSCPVWMYDSVPEIPMSKPLPVEDITRKYGTFFMTSTIAWMICCAIEDILEAIDSGDPGPHAIGLWGVDMAANEEYGYQRAGCQHFLLLAADLGINIMVPPESDLLRPMPLYGISESSHWMIKLTARRRELQSRLTMCQQNLENLKREEAFLQGAMDDMNYHMQTWAEDRDGIGVDPVILARCPRIREAVLGEAPGVSSEPEPEAPDGLSRTGQPIRIR